MGGGMQIEHLVLRDSEEIEDFFVTATGMKPGFMQLSAGLVNLTIDSISLQGAELIWSQTRSRHRWRDQGPQTGLHFALVVDAEQPVAFQGRDVDPNQIAIWFNDTEMDFVMNGPTCSLDVGVDQELLDELGWSFSGLPVMNVAPDAYRKLLSTCSLIRNCVSAAQLPSRKELADAVLLAWRDQLLDDIARALSPWLSKNGTGENIELHLPKSQRIVDAADAFCRGVGAEELPDMETLCKEVGVSRRSLFRSFHDVLGVGPRRYFELTRLNQFRRELKERHPDDVTVTELAYRNGFTQLGRLSNMYRETFGELPSATLRKTKN